MTFDPIPPEPFLVDGVSLVDLIGFFILMALHLFAYFVDLAL
jgi:hypothetical protein